MLSVCVNFILDLKTLVLVCIELFLSPQATFKGWMDIMYAAVDSRAVSVEQIA